MSRRCYYCGFPRVVVGSHPRVVQKTMKALLVPAYDGGYEYDEQVYAHPFCIEQNSEEE